jgi:hypothetical protein
LFLVHLTLVIPHHVHINTHRYHAVCDSTEAGDGMLAFQRGQLVFVRFAPDEGLWEGFTDDDNKVRGWLS